MSTPSFADTKGGVSLRRVVNKSEHRFDVKTLPADMHRVYKHLAAKNGEEYALLFIFNMRTAIELHRAWHMTLLTSKILQQVKDRFGLRMTWNLGVIRIIFRVEDGGFELHRKVPYDYDSEYQDLYTKIAVALVEGNINVHEALIFQTDVKKGKHTARSGLLLRDFPGRIILYPAEAATCAVIFFGGEWADAYIAAVCGFACGCVEWFFCWIGGEAKILIDIMVGITTGVIGGLFYRYDDQQHCLSAVFLGTLYWFFYGTAFVIGFLEIIAGELQTGVTRFIAVSVKTFVLSMGASIGLILTQKNVNETWLEQAENCNVIDLGDHWWRIPLYLACSASVLGQYRFPIVDYWMGLAVQLAAYEVQYQSMNALTGRHSTDNLDTATSNILGAMAGVAVACFISYVVERPRYDYYSRLLQRDEGVPRSATSNCTYMFCAMSVKLGGMLRLNRTTQIKQLKMNEKLKKQREELADPHHERQEIVLEPEEENILLETVVTAESLSIWAILMPAVYQLVPGSLIARLWFNVIFPPPLLRMDDVIPISDTQNITVTTYALDIEQENVFSGLMVVSASLALGLILGFAFVQTFSQVFLHFNKMIYGDDFDPLASRRLRERERIAGAYAINAEEDDPDSEDEKSVSEKEVEFTDEVQKLSVVMEQNDDGEGTEATAAPTKITTITPPLTQARPQIKSSGPSVLMKMTVDSLDPSKVPPKEAA